MQTPERRPVPALVFDSSIEDGIDQVLALALLLNYESKREVRVTALSVSRNNLSTATFCDLMGRFFGVSLSIGMNGNGTPGTGVPPMLGNVLARQTPDGKPVYPRVVERLNDTADPVALIRNALTAQPDQNTVVILAGSPANLLGMLALPGSKQLIQKKVRALVLAAPFNDTAGTAKLIGEWPGPVIFAGEDLGQTMMFPADSIEQDFTWAMNHPLVDAYRAAKAMPYDAPGSVMSAVLYAAHPEDGYFKLSEPGLMSLVAGGKLQFKPGPQGQHRQLIAEMEQKDRVVQAWRQTVSSKPPEPRRGARGGQP